MDHRSKTPQQSQNTTTNSNNHRTFHQSTIKPTNQTNNDHNDQGHTNNQTKIPKSNFNTNRPQRTTMRNTMTSTPTPKNNRDIHPRQKTFSNNQQRKQRNNSQTCTIKNSKTLVQALNQTKQTNRIPIPTLQTRWKNQTHRLILTSPTQTHAINMQHSTTSTTTCSPNHTQHHYKLTAT